MPLNSRPYCNALCLVVAFVCLSTAALGQNSPYPDVNGVRLGMSPEAIKQKLGTTYDWKITNILDPSQRDPNEIWISAGSNRTSNTLDAWLFGFVENRAIVVDHARAFPSYDLPDVNVTNQQVVEKYGATDSNGPVSLQKDTGQNFLYLYRQNGSVMTGNETRALLGCQQGNGGGARVSMSTRRPDPSDLTPKVIDFLIPSTDNREAPCPVSLVVEISHTTNGRANEATVTLVDSPALAAENKHFEQSQMTAEQKDRDKQAARTKAAGNPF